MSDQGQGPGDELPPTEAVPVAESPTEPPPGEAAPVVAPRRPIYRRPWVVIGAVAAVVLLMVAAVASTGSGKKTSRSGSSSATTSPGLAAGTFPNLQAAAKSSTTTTSSTSTSTSTTTTTVTSGTSAPPTTRSGILPPTTVPPTTIRPGTCTASVDNAKPTRNQTVHVTVASNVPNTAFTAIAHFQNADTTKSGTTDGTGAGTAAFRVGGNSSGFTVKVDVNISGHATCSTSFTPQ